MRSLVARSVAAGLALALMTAGAHAQMLPGSQIGKNASNASSQADKVDKDKAKANDKAYNSALHNLPDKQYDPWHGVR